MSVTGIIAEYNPFHSGHAYQIARARELTGCDHVVIAMSGSFTQRGEPGIIDKWTRARMALMCGADLVLELPCLFALREAQGFAAGGVELLNGTGIVDALSFGCETECIPHIGPVAECLAAEPVGYAALLREGLAQGLSYPRARARAAAEHLGVPQGVMDRPNFALALEYAQAISRAGGGMTMAPIPRTSDYHGLETGDICSASAIRAAVQRGDMDAALGGVPEQARDLLRDALVHPADERLMSDLALLRLRGMTPEDAAAYPGASEGLEHLLVRRAADCADAGELIAACKSKRYTYARLRRLLPQVVLGITREMQQQNPRPTYARVLGVRRDALGLLGEIKRRGTLPLITDVKQLPDSDPIWRLERRATDLWGMCTDDPQLRRAGRDYTHRFMVVE